MNTEQYNQLTAWFRENPRTIKELKVVNDTFKYLCYFMYPLLLVLSALRSPWLALRFFLVPAILFCALSIFRRVYNAPRPYEALDIDPLIHKSTRGKSFPSRHIFSVFMIAMCWLAYCVPVGIVLIVCGMVMAVIRVIGGVHFPRDVIAGAIVAVIGGFVGFWVFPMP